MQAIRKIKLKNIFFEKLLPKFGKRNIIHKFKNLQNIKLGGRKCEGQIVDFGSR